MKRSYIYGLLLSFLLGSSLYAQRAEYWLDSDPGRGKATALTLSGLSARRFCFEGFLPGTKKERKALLEKLRAETRTLILYEAPHHLTATLKDLLEAFGNRKISVCRELTKIHETVLRTTLSEAVAFYEAAPPKGECVLVLEGADESLLVENERAKWQELSIPEHMELYLSKGMDKKEAMKAVAKDRGVPKQEVYRACLEGDPGKRS